MSIWKDFISQPWKIKDLSLSLGFAKVQIDREARNKTLVDSYRFGFYFGKLAWGYAKQKTPSWVDVTSRLKLYGERIGLPKDMPEELIELFSSTQFYIDLGNAEIGSRSMEGIYTLLWECFDQSTAEACVIGYNTISILSQIEMLDIHKQSGTLCSRQVHEMEIHIKESIDSQKESMQFLSLKTIPSDFEFDFVNLVYAYGELKKLSPLIDEELVNRNA